MARTPVCPLRPPAVAFVLVALLLALLGSAGPAAARTAPQDAGIDHGVPWWTLHPPAHLDDREARTQAADRRAAGGNRCAQGGQRVAGEKPAQQATGRRRRRTVQQYAVGRGVIAGLGDQLAQILQQRRLLQPAFPAGQMLLAVFSQQRHRRRLLQRVDHLVHPPRQALARLPAVAEGRHNQPLGQQKHGEEHHPQEYAAAHAELPHAQPSQSGLKI